MKQVPEVKRYIDDGAGFFDGSETEFNNWINEVNNRLSTHGLIIDEYQIKDPNTFVPFLDIQFCFDMEGHLQTDLYVKQTDLHVPILTSEVHTPTTFSVELCFHNASDCEESSIQTKDSAII